MSKTVTPFIASLVQFNTTLPFAEVIARLDVEVKKVTSGAAKIMQVKNQQELKSLVEGTATDFLCLLCLFVKLKNSPSQITDTSRNSCTTSC